MAGIKQPSDKSHFLLPDLGEGLAEAELITWKVKAGDTVKESQTLAEMQTDKALVEVPSPWAGTVTEICGKPGDIIKVVPESYLLGDRAVYIDGFLAAQKALSPDGMFPVKGAQTAFDALFSIDPKLPKVDLNALYTNDLVKRAVAKAPRA